MMLTGNDVLGGAEENTLVFLLYWTYLSPQIIMSWCASCDANTERYDDFILAA